MFASSVLVLGVKVPDQVLLSPLVIVASDPLSAVMSSALEKEKTASEKTKSTSAVSPTKSNESSIVKELTVGTVVSTL